MAWIKRNLFFVIFSFVALILMGVGIWMLIAQMADESKVSGDIAKQYEELKRLNGLNPHPGDSTIDNIRNAKDQEAEIRALMAKIRPFFQRIPAIPDNSTNKVSNSEFAAELRNTVATLRHEAEQMSVTLPPDYYFTFESQRKIMIFDPASLDKLAVQLGEIKVLSEILFDAKVNYLDGIRRESVSTNDNNATDYYPRKTVTTPLADISPYELTFRSFSTELSQVLSHLASSPDGFIVKSICVEPTGAGGTVDEPGGMNNPGQSNPAMIPGRPGSRGPVMTPRAPVATSTSGPQQFLSEKLFRVTLFVDVVKIKPLPVDAAKPKPAPAK